LGWGSSAVAVVAADSANNSCSEAAAVAGRSMIAEDEAEVVVADVLLVAWHRPRSPAMAERGGEEATSLAEADDTSAGCLSGHP
jgi:hypothetical protein